MKTIVLSKFKLPSQLEMYEGKTDPMDHLDFYKNLMTLQRYSEVMCKVFLSYFKGTDLVMVHKAISKNH